MQTVQNNAVVTMAYALFDADKNEIEANEFAYLHGHNNIIPGLESALHGLTAGDKKNVTVAPENGYGEFQEELVERVDRSAFPEDQDIEIGMQFQTDTPEGMRIFTVVEINGDEIVLDGNHPMAGQTLIFDVEIKDIRKATEEEMAHGHVHGAHGHHH